MQARSIPTGVWVPIDLWFRAVSAHQVVSYAAVERDMDRAAAARRGRHARALAHRRIYGGR